MPSDPSTDANDRAGNILATVADGVTDWVSGVPAPIRKNALKAFGQLCTAVIDIPVAMLEGVAMEKRVETQARVKIISTGADQIAAQMKVDPEYARVAVRKYGQKIVREQFNLDKVSEVAALEINKPMADCVENEADVKEAEPIDDDWLNAFEKEASQKSTDEMQRLFGRILAGEIRKPSSFSIKTLKAMGQIDQATANLFRRLCSLSVSLKVQSHIIQATVLSLGGNAGSNALQKFGLSFDQLNRLHEYGLIISDYNSYTMFDFCVVKSNTIGMPLTFQSRAWALVPTQTRAEDSKLRLHGVALSSAGKELLGVVEIEANDEYTGALTEFFQKQNLTMTEVAPPKFKVSA